LDIVGSVRFFGRTKLKWTRNFGGQWKTPDPFLVENADAWNWAGKAVIPKKRKIMSLRFVARNGGEARIFVASAWLSNSRTLIFHHLAIQVLAGQPTRT